MAIEIERVIQINISYDDLQVMTCEMNVCDFWADLEEVDRCKSTRDLITDEQYNALKTGLIDYIVFREDY